MMKKNVPLVLQLNKGSGQPSAGIPPVKERQGVKSYKESFATQHSGVASQAGVTYDNPDKGKKWSHGEKQSLDDELEEDRQKDNEESAERGIIKKEMKKAFDPAATDLLKSLTANIYDKVNQNKLTDQELRFLREVKGTSPEDIHKSQLRITGRDRQAFSTWLADEFMKSLENLNVK